MSIALGLAIGYGARESSKYPFVYFAVSMGLWGILISIYLLTDDIVTATLAVKTYYVAAAALAHGFVLYCIALSRDRASPKFIDTIIKAILALAFVGVAAICLMPNGIVEVVQNGDDSLRVDINYTVYTVYMVNFVMHAVIAFYIMARTRLTVYSVMRRRQLTWMIGVTAFSVPMGALFNLFLPFFGNYTLVMVGPLFSVPIVFVVAYSIIRHGLFDVRFAAVRTVAYLLSLMTMMGLYFSLAYVASTLLFAGDDRGMTVNAIGVGLALILALIFQPVKQFFDNATDKIFYYGNYNTDEFIAELGTILTSTTDLKSLLVKVNAKIGQTFRVSWSSFVILRRERGIVQVGSGNYVHVDNETVLRLYDLSGRSSLMLQVEGMLQSESKSRRQTAQQLHKGGTVMILPLLRTDSHVGYLLLGERRAGRYSRRDIRVLETVSNELVIAIQNALSVQEVRDLNINLQQRIDQATERLRQTNDRLQKLDETKDEFISMASHQLRTPLTSIKGYLSMVLDGDVGEVNEQQRRFLTEAFTSSERMVRLIGDFLNVSRLQTGKFVVDRKPTDLRALVEDEVATMHRLAESHGTSLLKQIEESIPTLMLDEDKLRQVIMNLIDNAIYYSPGGAAILVKLAIKGQWVVFEVYDQGIGVPLHVQNQLFSKFFRADNARNQRPDGTGIGLFLAKKVISELNGEMVFESTPGKGSVFGFRLPIKKLQTPNWERT